MIKGLITGTFSGALVSGAVLVGASQVVPVVTVPLPAPQAPPVEVPPGTPFSTNLPDEAPILPETETPPTAAVPELASASPEISAPELDTSSADTPLSVAVDTALETPEITAGPEVSPNAEERLVISDASRPNTPVLEQDPAEAEAPQGGAAPSVTPIAEIAASPAPDDSPAAPETEAPPITEAASDALAAPSAEAEVASAEAPGAVVAGTTTGEAPSLAQLGEAPSLGQVPSQFASVEEPSLAQPELAPAPEAETLALPPEDGPSGAPAGPAITAFAAPFSPASDNPRVGLLLLDGPEAAALDLSAVGIPIAVAVDPLSPDAPIRMAELRAAGIEVFSLTPLVLGSSPADVEVAFRAFLSAVPQAVGVMDLPDALLQTSRPLSSQVVDIVKATGHGLVTYEKGLNSILQIADGAGVPAMTVTRVFDTGDSDEGRMRRFLDQGAFDATRAGRGVLVGHLRPEVLTAIAAWQSGNRAQTVELAPVSAVLTGK